MVYEIFDNLNDLIRGSEPLDGFQPFEVVYRNKSHFLFADDLTSATFWVASELGVKAEHVGFTKLSEAILAANEPPKKQLEKVDPEQSFDIPDLSGFKVEGLQKLAKKKKIEILPGLKEAEEILARIVSTAKAHDMSIHPSNLPF